jgi:hypothetical protein
MDQNKKIFAPTKQILPELLGRLELINTHIFPLAGGKGRRIDGPDSRLTKLQDPIGDEICFFEHFATVRDSKTNVFYIAFRETPDALYARSKDPKLFPEWLMKMKEKLSECQIFVYQVFQHPSQVAVLRSQEDWMRQIDNPAVFDTIVYFLGKNNVISKEALERFK